ncbi:unnamed protein product, partial [marine sediment metagenome]
MKNKSSFTKNDDSNWWKSLYEIRYKDGWREPPNIALKQVKFIEKSLCLDKNMKILDLGCGYGRHSIELAKRNYKSIIGLDYSSVLINAAKKEAKRQKVSVNFIKRNMLSMNFREEFDAILMMDVTFGIFSHTKNMLVIKKVADALKRNGKIFLDLFNIYSIHRFQKRVWY